MKFIEAGRDDFMMQQAGDQIDSFGFFPLFIRAYFFASRRAPICSGQIFIESAFIKIDKRLVSVFGELGRKYFSLLFVAFLV